MSELVLVTVILTLLAGTPLNETLTVVSVILVTGLVYKDRYGGRDLFNMLIWLHAKHFKQFVLLTFIQIIRMYRRVTKQHLNNDKR